jgi:hypothetical protein
VDFVFSVDPAEVALVAAAAWAPQKIVIKIVILVHGALGDRAPSRRI